MAKKKRRKFKAEYKAEVVDILNRGEKSLSQLCRDLDLVPSVVGNWRKALNVAKGTGSATSSVMQESTEIAELRRELRQVKMERDFLKKTAAFFARESS